MIEFRGPALRLVDLDLSYCGRLLGVGEDHVHAVLEVESSGAGFDKLGRPKILFEPHVFWRCLPESKRAAAARAGLAYPNWKAGAYGSSDEQYPKLLRAMAIDETAALKACSWGLGQILGENHKAAGFDTVQAMVLDAIQSEGNQLEQMIAFIKANKLDDELRRLDWHGFARGYNGAAYAKHNYHGRLAAAYARWQKIKDTPFTLEDFRKRAAAESAVAEATIGGKPSPAPLPPPPDIEPVAPKAPAPRGLVHDIVRMLAALFSKKEPPK